MILVCLSSSAFPFKRLVSCIDTLSKHFDDEIMLQEGRSHDKPVSSKVKRVGFIPIDEFDGLCKEARLVISQAGVGVLISCLSVGTPLIMVPRSAKYEETGTNHQFEMHEIVKRLGVEKQVVVVQDEDQLIQASKQHYGVKFSPLPVSSLPEAILSYIGSRSQEMGS